MFRHLESVFRYLERPGGLILFFTLVLEGVFVKVVLWLLKSCFFHLSTYLDYNMFLICSQGSLNFQSHFSVIWLALSSVRSLSLCEGHLPWCSGWDCPEGSMRRGSWDSLTLLGRDNTWTDSGWANLAMETESMSWRVWMPCQVWSPLEESCSGPFLLAFSENLILRKGQP